MFIVTGFHRSGTSLVAQSLQANGAHVGEDLIGSSFSNPFGHYEDRDVVKLHDNMLRINGHNWLTPRDFYPLVSDSSIGRAKRYIASRTRKDDITIGFKDPRASLFTQMWFNLMPQGKLIWAYRNPFDAAMSVVRRSLVELAHGNRSAINFRRSQLQLDLVLEAWSNYSINLLSTAKALPKKQVQIIKTDTASLRHVDLRNASEFVGLNTGEFVKTYEESLIQPTNWEIQKIYRSESALRVRKIHEEICEFHASL